MWGCQPYAQPPTWRTRISLLVWVITLDLSGMGGPTISIHYRQHSSGVRMTTQAPPLHQSRDTFGGSLRVVPWHFPYNCGKSTENAQSGFFLFFYFFKRFIAPRVYAVRTRINYKIVPLTSLNKYLHCGTSGTE